MSKLNQEISNKGNTNEKENINVPEATFDPTYMEFADLTKPIRLKCYCKGLCCNFNFKRFIQRIKSYPENFNISSVQLIELAIGGFEYIGEKERVRCQYCGVTIAFMINPVKCMFQEHFKYSPQCDYLNNFI